MQRKNCEALGISHGVFHPGTPPATLESATERYRDAVWRMAGVLAGTIAADATAFQVARDELESAHQALLAFTRGA